MEARERIAGEPLLKRPIQLMMKTESHNYV